MGSNSCQHFAKEGKAFFRRLFSWEGRPACFGARAGDLRINVWHTKGFVRTCAPMKKHASLAVLFVTVFMDLVGFGIVLPLLPFMGTHFHASALMVSALNSIFSLMQFLCAPFWGRLSDRIGRRPVLLWSLAGSTVSYLLLGFCDSFWQIFATRALAGFFGANIAVANAYIADITTPENRSKGMGMIGAAFGLGFVFGPLIGGLIAQFGTDPSRPDHVYRLIGWVAAAICGINFLVACFNLPESRRPESAPAQVKSVFLFSAWQRAFSIKAVGVLIALYFVFGFAFSNFENLFGLLLKGRFFFDVREANYFFFFVGLVVAGVQGGMIGKLVKRYGEARLIVMGGLLFVVSFIWLPFTFGIPSLLGAILGIGVGQGLNRSAIMGLISQQVSAEEQGLVLGVAQSSGSLARILGPLVGGALYDRAPAAPFLLSAALILLLLGLSGSRLPKHTS